MAAVGQRQLWLLEGAVAARGRAGGGVLAAAGVAAPLVAEGPPEEGDRERDKDAAEGKAYDLTSRDAVLHDDVAEVVRIVVAGALQAHLSSRDRRSEGRRVGAGGVPAPSRRATSSPAPWASTGSPSSDMRRW